MEPEQNDYTDGWERVSNTQYTYRLSVPGGWIYRYHGNSSIKMLFVPYSSFMGPLA